MSRKQLHSVSRRRRQRGAVFIEALLVLTLQTLVLSAVMFLYTLCSRSIESQQIARAQAFLKAGGGCGQSPNGGGFGSPEDFQKFESDPGDGSGDQGALGPAAKDGASDSAKPAMFAGKTYTTGTKISVTCNEVGQSEDEASNQLGLTDWISGKVSGMGGL